MLKFEVRIIQVRPNTTTIDDFIDHIPRLNMKTIAVSITVAFLAGLTFAAVPRFQSAPDECANCKTNMSKMAAFLATDMVIEATVTSFKNDLCPYLSNDTKACQKNVTAVWPAMAKAFFNEKTNPTGPTLACQTMKQCNKTLHYLPRSAKAQKGTLVFYPLFCLMQQNHF